MAGHLVYTLEDESPWHLGNLADYLRVHQVAQTYEARRNGGGYGYIVEHLPQVHVRTAVVEPQGHHQA